MNKIEELKSLRQKNLEVNGQIKDFLTDLSITTPNIIAKFRDNCNLEITKRDTNNFLVLSEDDAFGLYEFLKSVFEEKETRIDNKKIAENLAKTKEKQKNLE